MFGLGSSTNIHLFSTNTGNAINEHCFYLDIVLILLGIRMNWLSAPCLWSVFLDLSVLPHTLPDCLCAGLAFSF